MKRYSLQNKGTTLVETLIATAFFVVVSLAIYNAWATIVQLNQNIKVKEILVAMANEEFEVIRNMPYADIGIVLGVPDGTLEDHTDVVREGMTFRIDRYVRNIDEEFDGTQGGDPDDDSPADSKLVELKIRCQVCTPFIIETFTTNVSPKGLESSSGNGSLKIIVIDADGDPVPAANVSIDNYEASPNILIRDETDVNGTLTIVDAPPYTQAYEIRIDKTSEWSEDQTYDSADIGGSTPVLPHATVIENELTQITLSIDKYGGAGITSVDSACAAVPNFDFDMHGAKLIGTSPDVYGYDDSLATNGAGSLSVSDLVWDTYSIESNDGTYEIVGANPLIDFAVEPNQAQNVELIVAAKNTPTMLVTVKDQNTGLPVDDADVTITQITGGSYTDSDTTYRGSFVQTDWSGGGSQSSYIDETKFYSRTNIEYGTAGEIKLRTNLGSYYSAGALVSSTYDTGSPSTFGDIDWTPVSQPAQTGTDSLKFQVAANNDNATWSFTGPDGTGSTYYTTSNKTLSATLDGNRYVRYRAIFSTSNTAYTPTATDVSITHTTGCTPSGQVAFQNLPTGTYEVLVEKSGYNEALSTVSVTSGSWQNAEVFISEG